jgi:glyoxalase family protein
MQLTGMHHVTAISSDIRENYRFYTQVMGMRLVKRSVNQDDVRAYHLFYADAIGSAGTDLTFFDWKMPREKRGNHGITRTCLRVDGEAALAWWKNHLTRNNVQTGEISLRDNRLSLDFEDSEGQRLTLVDDGGKGDGGKAWDKSPVPAEFQIRGLGPIVMSVPNLGKSDVVLTSVLNMRRVREYPHPENSEDTVHVYEMNEGGPHAELHVAVQPGLPFTSSGAGGVHHVAFRTPDENNLPRMDGTFKLARHSS